MSELPPWSFRVGRRVIQVPLVGWLVVVWVVLWGSVSVANVLSGLALALLITGAFPLPPADPGLRLRPVGTLRFLGWFAADMAVSSARVVAEVFRFGTPPRNAVVAVDLRTESDAVLTITALTLTAIPGSVIVEVRRSTRTLFVHVLGASDPASVARARREVEVLEVRVARAFGTRSEIERLG